MEQNQKRSLCMGILAHVDAGKTTVTEQLLYLAGAIRAAGRVDSGTAQTDWLEVERRRGISVRASETALHWGGLQLNLIDTPGHVDFAGEVERCLDVLDGAVLVLSAVEGVQAQTRLLWKALRAMEIPTLLLINKIDRAGADPERVLAQIRKELSPAALPLQRAVHAGEDAASVCPAEELADEILAAAAEFDEEAEEAFLEERAPAPGQPEQWLRRGTGEGKLFPVLLGSAKNGVGMKELLEAVARLLPPSRGSSEGPLSGLVYRISHDPVMGKGAHLRLFSGRLQNRDAVSLSGRGSQKISQIRQILGAKSADLGTLSAGEIGVVYGLTDAAVGDVVGEKPPRHHEQLAVPLLTVQVFAEKEELQPRLAEALRELTDEDPLLDLEWIREKRELHLKVTGVIQLEVLAELIRDRYQLEVTFSSPSVIYRETPSGRGVGRAVYLAPKPCWAIVELEVEPLPRGSGVRFRSAIGESTLPVRYQNHVAQALPDALKQGLLGWEVTDALFTLTNGQSHQFHTHPLDFFVATPMAVMDALEQAGTTLLEPMVRVTLSAPEGLLGRVVGDILAMRGSFDTPEIGEGVFTLEALLPAATSLDYPVEFRSLTGGKGTYLSEFAGYQPCPVELGAVQERRGIDPRDRERWILHKRGAMQL
ncbi:MAG: TetM/TetW/TetO/TetS family tetracycline resistance ribosomal protection protein [Oscillospiraceae bacterium]|nr:TetM/TetW/TetO/TetS family tetracycline resistance ribosomal protection protein [Oscillospiraceae bacterium]